MLSYRKGADAGLIESSIPQIFAATAARFPDRDALIVLHQNIRLTWRELDDAVSRLAAGLSALGLVPGDRVGIWSANCAEWVVLQLAAAQAQLVLVNINPAYRSHELRYVLQKSRMRAIFLWDKDERGDYRRILDEAREGQSLDLRHIIYFGEDAWQRLVSVLNRDREGASPNSPVVPASSDPHAVINMQYTSGTTGAPKGVLLTHHNLINNGAAIAENLLATERDRICVPVPLFHCFGCVGGSMISIISGAAMILPSPRFDPRATLSAVDSERASIIYGVPAMFIAELEHPEFASFQLTSLRTGIMAGAPCPIEVMKRVMTEMHCSGITIAYGQTEASPVITMSRADDPVETRVTTVGMPLINTEVKIVAPTGETQPPGEPGELCARGYLVMKGYDGEPEATRRAIDTDGWLHTGDLAIMRPDGYIKITGRARDMIIRGGENIYPREIEEFLHTHPKIAEVQVVGVPDDRMGEAVAVWVRLRAAESTTEDEIREYCQDRIACFKIPKYIRFVDAFPMTVSGKVQKFRMREVEICDRNLGSAAAIETA